MARSPLLRRFQALFEDFDEAERSGRPLEAVREQVTAEVKASAKLDFKKQLLTLSQFLRAAAAMRRSGDEASSENRAFEGILFQVYGGSHEAVESMTKLIEGASDKVPSVEGEPLDVTCKSKKLIFSP